MSVSSKGIRFWPALVLAILGVLVQILFPAAFAQQAAPGPAFPAIVPDVVIDLPLLIDGKPFGDVTTGFDRQGRFLGLRAESLVEALSGEVEPQVLDTFAKDTAGLTWVNAAALGASGLGFDYDENSLLIEIKVPVELRPLKQIALTERQPKIGARGLTPQAKVSSQLNLHLNLDYLHQTASGSGKGRQPLNADLDWAVNLWDLVLENDFAFSEADNRKLQRRLTRVVFDDTERALRYAAGDLFYPVAGFQQFQSMRGVTMARNFNLQPYRVTTPTGRASFQLLQESQVEVLVDQTRRELLRLPAGRYEISDFNVGLGSNDAQLRITDPNGRVQTIDLTLVVGDRMLPPDVHEYAYSLGLPSSNEAGLLDYEEDFPAFSAFHRLGLADDLTVGANLQGGDTVQLLGSEAVYASPLGVTAVDAAVSRHSAAGAGWAIGLGHRLFGSGIGWEGGGLTLSSDYRSRNFAALGSDGSANRVLLDSRLRFNQSLDSRTRLGAGLRYRIGRPGQRNTHDASLSLSRKLGRRWSVNAQAGHRSRTGGRRAVEGFLSVSLDLHEDRQLVVATHDIEDQATTVNWNYQGRSNIRDLRGSLFAARSDRSYRLGGNLFFNDYRFESSLSHEYARTGGGGREQRSSLRLGTGLLFADGVFALGRPVGDSFVLVSARPEFGDWTVGVERAGEEFTGRIDALGPAVISNVSSHLVRTVRVEAPDLPLGYDLGPGLFQIRPGYRSGTVIEVGTPATVLLDGRLLSAEGEEPLALLAGSMRYIDDGTVGILDFFTNRTGRFRVDGVRPGRYDLWLLQWPETLFRIEIPEGSKGRLKIGDIVLPVEVKR